MIHLQTLSFQIQEDGNDVEQWKWIYKWLNVHLAICKKKLQKPLVLSEFSEFAAKNGDCTRRREFLKRVN